MYVRTYHRTLLSAKPQNELGSQGCFYNARDGCGGEDQLKEQRERVVLERYGQFVPLLTHYLPLSKTFYYSLYIIATNVPHVGGYPDVGMHSLLGTIEAHAMYLALQKVGSRERPLSSNGRRKVCRTLGAHASY